MLRRVRSGEISPESALSDLITEPFVDLGFAKLDTHRGLRQSVGEVIFGSGKTVEQISAIVTTLHERGADNIMITRLDADKNALLSQKIPNIVYHVVAGIAVAFPKPRPLVGTVVVATAGTSDLPVSEEAAVTLETLGSAVTRLYDVGVAGIHRLLSRQKEIESANVVIAVAGMEGALASVIGGLADCPVVAVPTSIGYGANFGGLSALLSMLNSCAAGVSVVNIDNGFGAGFLAHKINVRTVNKT